MMLHVSKKMLVFAFLFSAFFLDFGLVRFISSAVGQTATQNDSHLDKVLSKADAIRFERRVGIGAPPNRVKPLIGMTRREAIDKTIKELTDFQDKIIWPQWIADTTPTSFMEQGLKKERHSCDPASYRLSLEAAWARLLIESETPQFERLALFWLNHFSVAYDAYGQTHSFAKHLKIIRRNANGNFIHFLNESLQDPGVIVYLNNEKSSAKTPNENLAREFLELFSLGEGQYSEQDIKSLAKALAGNGINYVTEDFQFYSSKLKSLKETGAFEKKLSFQGKKYKDLEGFFRIFVKHPALGEFIAKKFYQEYVELNEPSKSDLEFLVASFRASDYDIKALLKSTLSLKTFWDENNRLTLVKSPLELIFGTIRTLNIAGNNGQDFQWALSLARDFGQELFNPPNIAGWPTGKEWLSGQMLESRINRFPGYFDRVLANNMAATNGISLAERRRKRTKKTSDDYQRDLAEFFADTTGEQLAVETFTINWIPSDFSTREWADINVAFYNVHFLGKKWDGISVTFGTDINSKRKASWKQLDRIQFKEGSSYPPVLASYSDGWVGSYDGHRGWSSSFPSGPKEKFSKKSKEEQLLMLRLLQAMKFALENDTSFLYLFQNEEAKNWLEKQIEKAGFDDIQTSSGNFSPVKVFSYLKQPMGSYTDRRKFICSLMRTGENIYDYLRTDSLDNSLDLAQLKAGPEKFLLTELLLPALSLPLEDNDLLTMLSHEGYQLK